MLIQVRAEEQFSVWTALYQAASTLNHCHRQRDQRRSILVRLYYKAYPAAAVIQKCEIQHNMKKAE